MPANQFHINGYLIKFSPTYLCIYTILYSITKLRESSHVCIITGIEYVRDEAKYLKITTDFFCHI